MESNKEITKRSTTRERGEERISRGAGENTNPEERRVVITDPSPFLFRELILNHIEYIFLSLQGFVPQFVTDYDLLSV